ncbi:MAG: RNA pyrophosphohydrolase [Ferrovibrio sp.]|uniref:RNA pyrophosphohydrolase n=1 Tax=Ferrovibrio sp. TaxID=1917215 RepID=UPI0026308ACD|nr:RNA pyrophosphohydrolase [Ferrovibrio sp.]MCW0233611.1 RNA pyrophosphohydrolase [Ferrovibrio sp.]
MTSAADSDARPYRDGVGVALLNADDMVFVGQRIDQTAEAWQMPQGGIDPGEDPLQAALREMEEEIGVPATLAEVIAESRGWLSYDLPRDLADKVWKGKYRGQRQKWYLARFKGRDSDINIQTAHPEFNQWRWLPFRQLPEMIVPFKRPIYELIVAEFADRVRT